MRRGRGVSDLEAAHSDGIRTVVGHSSLSL